jgi:hypothetical protein
MPPRGKKDSGSGGKKGSGSEWEPSGDEAEEQERETVNLASGTDDDFEPPPPRAKPKAAPAKRAKAPAKPKKTKAAAEGGEGDGPVPKKKKTKIGYETGNYFVESAKTGRAKCQVCGFIIVTKEMRFGIEVDEASSWGVITRWQHLACSRVPLDLDPGLIAGLGELEQELQALARETLYSVAPLPADEVDPDEVHRGRRLHSLTALHARPLQVRAAP